MNPIVEIKGLTVYIQDKKILDNIRLELYPGRITVLVGESGSGKTMTSLSVLDLLPAAAEKEGAVIFKGKDIFEVTEEEKREIRGRDISMVFQEPFTALNPVMTAGVQVKEVLYAHGYSRTFAAKRVDELFEMVMLPSTVKRQYPHELSGGMRQRVMLAIALACDPSVLILDEPTTALDVTIQKKILDLIIDIQKKIKFSVMFITHDFSIVRRIADDVYVMREGVIVENGTREEVLENPSVEYTRQLIRCVPVLGDKRKRLEEI